MWIFLAFLSAVFVSLLEIVTKKISHKVDIYVMSWSWLFFSLPSLYLLLFIERIPPLGPQFWGAVLASTTILTISVVCYCRALQSSDLSTTVPMLAFTPILLLVTSPVMLKEYANHWGIIAIVMIVLGSYILNIKSLNRGWFYPFKALFDQSGPRFMLIVAVLYSIGANVDKIGVINSSPFMWVLVLYTSLSVILTGLMIIKSRNIYGQLKAAWPILLLAGSLNGIGVLFQMYAIKLTLVPYVIGIKRTSVIMTSLFGLIYLKEKGLIERLIGISLMVLGVFMISFMT